MSEQHPKCPRCGSEMKIIPLKPGERTPPKHVEGKGTYFPYKCVNDDCGTQQEFFQPYKSS